MWMKSKDVHKPTPGPADSTTCVCVYVCMPMTMWMKREDVMCIYMPECVCRQQGMHIINMVTKSLIF
jgi:hypothetical protein